MPNEGQSNKESNNNSTQLAELRQQIDQVDNQLRELFLERMNLVQQVAIFKKEQKIPILHPDREEEILARLGAGLGPGQKQDVEELFKLLFEISRRQQGS